MPVIELVQFRITSDADPAAFEHAAAAAGRVLEAMPGFVGRRLAKSADGEWLDLVEWTDRGSAEAAAQVFHTRPEAQPFCSMIDMDTARMTHHEVAQKVGA